MFVMCEQFAMTEQSPTPIGALRKSLGLSLEDFAKRVGLTSKGYASQLERGEVGCSVKTALAIEELSGGAIAAATLNPDVALVEKARGIEVGEQAA